MPSSTLNQPRTRARSSEWVVVVPGRQPDRLPNRPESVVEQAAVRRVAVAPKPRLTVPAGMSTALQRALMSGAGRMALLVALVCANVALLGLVTGRDPLLALGLRTPQFVAYEGVSAEQVRFVMDDGWSQTAAVPGALLMDWREGAAEQAMRVTMGNPAAEPIIEQMSADGSQISAIRYRSAWPGIDSVIRTMPGGWLCEMIVQPGVDSRIIELEYVGATALTVDRAGRLHVQSPHGEWIEGTPESWQDGPSGREPVTTSYELRGDNRVGFTVGPYDPSRPLVVDPPSERVR